MEVVVYPCWNLNPRPSCSTTFQTFYVTPLVESFPSSFALHVMGYSLQSFLYIDCSKLSREFCLDVEMPVLVCGFLFTFSDLFRVIVVLNTNSSPSLLEKSMFLTSKMCFKMWLYFTWAPQLQWLRQRWQIWACVLSYHQICTFIKVGEGRCTDCCLCILAPEKTNENGRIYYSMHKSMEDCSALFLY